MSTLDLPEQFMPPLVLWRRPILAKLLSREGSEWSLTSLRV
jgi:hypothetical protein